MKMLDRIRRRLRPGGAARSLTCIEMVEIITEYLEGTLPPSDRARFEAHLEGCEGCRNYLDQMRLTIRLVGRVREDAIPPRMKEILLQAFRSRKRGNEIR